MKITIYNKKGGTGKSTVSGLLYLQIKEYLKNQSINKSLKVYTNDDSILQDIYPEDVIFKHNLKSTELKDDICILDLGGFVDSETAEILEDSDIVLIPFTPNINSLRRTLALIQEMNELNIHHYNLIFTQFMKKKQVEEVQEIFGKENIEYYLPFSNMLDFQIKNELTFKDIKKNGVFNNWYKNHIPIFEKFTNDILKILK